MKTLKTIFAGFFTTIGLAIVLLFAIDIANPNTTPKDKEGAWAALCLFGLPSTAIGGWMFRSLRQQHQQQINQIEHQKEQVFLHLLEERKGEITITSFALAAQMSVEEAKKYLDDKAKQLDATFEPSNEGGIIYKFPI